MITVQWSGKKGMVTAMVNGKKYNLTDADKYPMDIPLQAYKQIITSSSSSAICLVPVSAVKIQEAMEDKIMELQTMEEERDSIIKELESLKKENTILKGKITKAENNAKSGSTSKA